MLNYEYDAEAEKRILRQEGIQEGMQKERQKMIELMLKVQQGNISIDEALNKAGSIAALEGQ
jgi:hypothetical protein